MTSNTEQNPAEFPRSHLLAVLWFFGLLIVLVMICFARGGS